MRPDSFPSRMLPTKVASAAGMVVAAISMLQACEASSTDPWNDAGTNGDAPLTDAHGDVAIEGGTVPDASSETVATDTSADTSSALDVDATPLSERFEGDSAIESEPALDVTPDTVARDSSADTFAELDVDAQPSDAPAADSMLADAADAADVFRDATDGDGGCQCLAADSGWEVATISLDCFLQGAQVAAYDHAAYAADPCIGLHGAQWGYRSEQTYADHHLIGVYTSGLDGPRYEYFYDATTKALVGATRISWWTGWDPLNCTGQTGHYVTVRAGVLPDCDGGTCAPTSSRTLCAPPDSGFID